MSDIIGFKGKVDFTQAKKDIADFERFLRSKGISLPTAPVDNFTQANTRMTRAMRESLLQSERLRQEGQRLRNEYEQGRINAQQLTAQTRALNEQRRQEAAAARAARQAQQAASGSYREAQQRLAALGREIRDAEGGFRSLGAVQQARIREYRELNAQLTEFDRRMGNNQRNVGNYSSALAGLQGLVGTYLSATAAIAGAGQIIGNNAEISDSLADVTRTAQLTAKEADALLETLKKFDTRTTLKGLVDIATIGGQMGVAKEDIAGFTKSIDQLSVVLSGEIPGGAEEVASALGKINGVFKTQRQEGTSIDEAYNRTGSAILGLGQAGLATGGFLQDFTLRVGGAAVAANISLPAILAYGSVLEEAGSSAEVSGTSLNRLIGTLSTKRDKFFAIAQLGDASLTLNEFTKIINTDANEALQLFFKGLNSNNPSLTQFSDRLDTIGIKAGPSKNAIIALAQNQEKLSEKIKMSTQDYLDAGKIQDQFALKNENLAGALAKMWNGLTNTFVSSGLSKKLAEMLNNMANGKTDIENLTSAYKANKEEVERNESEMRPLLKRYDELTSKAKSSGGAIRLTRDDQESLREVTAKIGELMPSVITQFDKYGNAMDINRGKVDQMTKAQRELLAAQNSTSIERANTSFDNATAEQKRMQQAIIDGAKSGKSNSVLESGRQSVILLRGLAYESAKSVRDLGGSLTKQQQDIINYYEKVTPVVKKKVEEIKKVSTETKDTSLSADEKNLAEINERLRNLQAGQDAKTLKAEKAALEKRIKQRSELLGLGSKSNRSADAEIKAAESFSKKLNEIHNASFRKTLSNDDAEKQAVKDKYEAFGKEAENFYKKYGVKAVVKINGKNVSKSQVFGTLEADQKKELDAIDEKRRVDKEKKEAEEKQKHYEQLLKDYMDFGQKMDALEKQFNIDAAALVNDPRQLAVLREVYEKNRQDLIDSNSKKLDDYEKLVEGIEKLSKKEAFAAVEIARKQLKSDLAAGLVSEKVAKQAEALYDKVNKSVEKGAKDAGEELIGLANEMDRLVNSIGGMDTAFGKVLSTVSNLVGQVGNIQKGIDNFEKADTDLGKLTAGLGIVGAGISIFKTVFSLFDRSKQREEQAAYARDLQNKQTEAVNKALERQIALLDDVYGTERITKYNAAIEQAQQNEAKYRGDLESKFVLSGNKEFDRLLTQINNGEKLSGDVIQITKFIKAMQGGQFAKLPQDIESLQRLLDEKLLDESTATIVENLIKANSLVDELGNKERAERVGSSIGQIADDFIKTLTDGTQDFGKSFEDTIRTSILNGFKGQLIEQQLQAFYKQFAELSTGGLTAEEIETLRTAYTTAAEKAKKDIEDLEKATGIKLTGDTKTPEALKPNTLTASLNQPTGERLEGLWRGQFDLTKQLVTQGQTSGLTMGEMLQIGKGKLAALERIAANTLRSANNTDRLEAMEASLASIEKNTKLVKSGRD